MSNQPTGKDYYDETLVNHNDYSSATKNAQTKILTQRKSVDVAMPEKDEGTSHIRPWRVSLNIEESKVELVFEVNERIAVGRSSRYEHPFAGIDLSPFNGHELGVSRLHAEISQKNEQIVIVDKGSSNGTLLNQQRLKPDIAYIIRHGDVISFGNMKVNIHFLTPVFQPS